MSRIRPSLADDMITANSPTVLVQDGVSDRVSDGVPGAVSDGVPDGVSDAKTNYDFAL
jgi:hypothetical protein